jgi:hypothetical protein
LIWLIKWLFEMDLGEKGLGILVWIGTGFLFFWIWGKMGGLNGKGLRLLVAAPENPALWAVAKREG